MAACKVGGTVHSMLAVERIAAASGFGRSGSFGIFKYRQGMTWMDSAIVLVLVEDEPSHARLIEIVLRGIGVENDLVVLGSGTEALEYLMAEGRYAGRAMDPSMLVLLDLNLPGVTGHEILRRMRDDVRTSTTPVIIVTSSDDPVERDQCLALGANGYLVKPPSPDELAEAFRSLDLPGAPGRS